MRECHSITAALVARSSEDLCSSSHSQQAVLSQGQGSCALSSWGFKKKPEWRFPTSLVTCPRTAPPLGEEVFLHLQSELPTAQPVDVASCSICLPLPIRVMVIHVARHHWRSSGPTPTQGWKLDPAAIMLLKALMCCDLPPLHCWLIFHGGSTITSRIFSERSVAQPNWCMGLSCVRHRTLHSSLFWW